MYEEIRKLILREQARDASFIGVDLHSYMEKLMSSAEFFLHLDKGLCRGFIAYYCNDETTLTAYVTLILVAPESRRSGLGRLLIDSVIEQARNRGFRACRLEVNSSNLAAQAFYGKLGFYSIDDRAGKILMESKL